MDNTAGNIGVELNLEIKQGSDFAIEVDFTNSADDSVFDLTPFTHVAHLRKKPFATPVQSFVCTSPIPGRLRFAMTHTTTALLTCGSELDSAKSSYVWDHEMVRTSDGTITPCFYGDVSVFRDV